MRQQVLCTQKVLVRVLRFMESGESPSGIFSNGDRLLWNNNGASNHKIQNNSDSSSVLVKTGALRWSISSYHSAPAYFWLHNADFVVEETVKRRLSGIWTRKKMVKCTISLEFHSLPSS
ncbi:hypothetical protein VPH35_138897 [Triticum aestivum]